MKKLVFVKKNVVLLLSVLLLISLILIGCTSGAKETKGDNSEDTASKGAREVIVGVGNKFPPYDFINENNEPDGYEVAILKEVDKRLPQYKFKYDPIGWDNMLLSLDSGKIEIASHQIVTTPEREKKYLLTKEWTSTGDNFILYKKGRTDITDLDSLGGKKVTVYQGSAEDRILLEYNKTHDKQIDIVYFSSTNEMLYDDIVSGRIDASIWPRSVFDEINNAYGGGLAITDYCVKQQDCYYLLNKGSERLRDDIDKVLAELKQDGTMSELAIKYTGHDYTYGKADPSN